MSFLPTDRLSIVRDLLEFSRPLVAISVQLEAFEWDYTGDGVTLTRRHLLNVLQQYLNGSLKDGDIEVWANLIEGREDVYFDASHDQKINDALHELANPLLTQSLDYNRAAALRQSLL